MDLGHKLNTTMRIIFLLHMRVFRKLIQPILANFMILIETFMQFFVNFFYMLLYGVDHFERGSYESFIFI